MTFRYERSAWLLAVTGMALAAGVAGIAQDAVPRRSRSIQFSEPRSTEVSSNLNEISSEKPTLHSLERELKKPFDLFNRADDSAGVLTPPAQRTVVSPTQTKRMREQLEKRNEWIFLGAEDYEPGMSAEEMLNVPEVGPDGELKKPRTALERYYDRLEKARAAATNQAGGSDTIGLSERGVGKEASGESSFGSDRNSSDAAPNETQQTLKRLANLDTVGTSGLETSGPKTFSEFFGFAKTDQPENPQQSAQAFKSQLEAFKLLLESGPSASPGPGASSLSFLPGPQATPAQSVPPGGSASFSAAGAPGGILTPISANPTSLTPLPSLPTLTPSPGLPGWQASPPVQSPPSVTLPMTTFSLPQRKF